MTDIHLETVLPVSPSVAYSLFTRPTLLEQWMCNSAASEVRAGGSFFYTWTAGWWVVGDFTAVEPDKRLAFTWQPKAAPASTQVDITFTAEGDSTRVRVHHTGFESEVWTEEARAEHLEGWTSSLNDLTYLIETGLDSRFMRRPMMGINFEALTPEIANRLNSPVTLGLALTGVVEGSGASNAGLKPNDILVNLDGVDVASFQELTSVIQRHKSGDVVPVAFYRNGEKSTVHLTFGQRPTPKVASSQQEFVETMRGQIDAVVAELDTLLASVTDAEMSFNPAEGAWSGKQVLAHCIWGERWSAMNIWSIAGGGEYIGWVGNPAYQIAGLLAVHPTVESLQTELKRALYELPAMIEALDSTVLNNPALFKYLSATNAETGDHVREHFAQIKAAVEASRQAVLA